MELNHQKSSIIQLQHFADKDTHSIIIYGLGACGKTHLAKEYANMLNISDFQVISPTVAELRSTIDECMQLSTPIVLCIENIDTAVFAASSVLLKFLEDASHRIYIIVTARNIKYVQDTIISRCHTVEVNSPTRADLTEYAKAKYSQDVLDSHTSSPIWGCLQNFNDIDTFLSMNASSIEYIENIPKICRSSKCVSDTVWALQKYPDKENGDTPINLVIRYIMYCYPELLQEGIDCIHNLELRRIASYVVITKFVFDIKQKEVI